MKKILFSFILLMGITYCMAQTAPINQTPAQLAEQMVVAISRDVTLTMEQLNQITATATQYFTDMRDAAQSTPHVRTALYEQFQQTLKDIMTDDLYYQWRNAVENRMLQRISELQQEY